MKLDKHIVDMFTELTKPTDDVKMEKTCYGTISVVDGTRYVKLDGSDLLVPAASTVKTSHGDRVTVLMKNHSLTITGNLTAPATDGEGGSSGEAGTAATIEVGTVTTGEAGSSASVTNSGTTSAAVFDFVIPRGDKGEKGDTGPQGPQGEKGDTGTWDGTIPDHKHTVSDITDFPTALPANGGNADTVDGLGSNVIPHGYQMAYHDANLCIKSGYYMLSPGDSNIPVDTYGILAVNNGDWADSDATWASQIFMPTNGGSAYRRMYVNKSFTAWVNLANGGNADTLESHPASDFALKTDIPTTLPANGGIADTARQTVSPNAKAMLWEDSEGGNLHLISPDGNHEVEMDLYNNSFRMVFIDNGELTLAADYNSTTKKFNINGNADTLDGKHAENFMQWLSHINDADFLNNANHKVDYHCNISDGTIIGLPVAGWYHIVYYMHLNTNGYGMQIAYPLNFDGATMIRRASGTTWGTWKNIADGGTSSVTNHQRNHYLGMGVDVLTYATSDNCAYNTNTKVRIMNCPTCPTNYGYNAANNDFWYDIYKIDNSWVQIKAYDVRGNAEFINSCLNGTWSGWARCNDGGTAVIANYAGSVSSTSSNICLRNLSSGTAAATTDNCPVGTWYGQHS